MLSLNFAPKYVLTLKRKRMKRIYLTLMCVAGLALATACGGGEKKGAEATGDKMNTEEAVEEAKKASEEMSGIEKCAQTIEKAYGLKLSQLEPDFEFAEVTEGYDSFGGNGANSANIVYKKKDGSDISKEEYEKYAEKIFALTKTLSNEGKNIHGYDGMSELTPEQANAEVTLRDCLDSGFPQWAFKNDKGFQACQVFLQDSKSPNYISVKLSAGLSGNI